MTDARRHPVVHLHMALMAPPGLSCSEHRTRRGVFEIWYAGNSGPCVEESRSRHCRALLVGAAASIREPGMAGQGMAGLGGARQNEAEPGSAMQDKTRQDKEFLHKESVDTKSKRRSRGGWTASRISAARSPRTCRCWSRNRRRPNVNPVRKVFVILGVGVIFRVWTIRQNK